MLNLNDPSLLRRKAYIDGVWCDADEVQSGLGREGGL